MSYNNEILNICLNIYNELQIKMKLKMMKKMKYSTILAVTPTELICSLFEDS